MALEKLWQRAEEVSTRLAALLEHPAADVGAEDLARPVDLVRRGIGTPQRVAQDDAIRALRMFQQLRIDVLGVVENMSYFVGDDGKEYDIFGKGGAEMMAQQMGLPFLGSVPISMGLRRHSDAGEPSRNFDDDTALASDLEGMVRKVAAQVKVRELADDFAGPTLTVR
ncbi:MAG: Mrp/NBP35 family ATP-binding protein [Thermoanaerobaculia bacterium]|nr:Mrp/NBP35 family ATP-binding protein [Thermoanaerobaculia bacterium]